jgi:hypothetical protein
LAFFSKTRDRCYDFKNIFAKKFATKLFLLKLLPFCKKIVHNIGFGEKRQFFAENWQKSQKLVIITSTPGTDVLILKIFFAKNFGESIGVFRSNK